MDHKILSLVWIFIVVLSLAVKENQFRTTSERRPNAVSETRYDGLMKLSPIFANEQKWRLSY